MRPFLLKKLSEINAGIVTASVKELLELLICIQVSLIVAILVSNFFIACISGFYICKAIQRWSEWQDLNLQVYLNLLAPN